jgi:uncharacterized protein with von Willebrand factor type A (vWA) domain
VRARFSRWDATQDPFGADADLGEVLDAISDDLLMGWDPRAALERLRARGVPGTMRGIEDLLRSLRASRDRARRHLDPDGSLDRLRRELDEILDIERAELATRPDPRAREQEALLHALPDSPTARVEELGHYEFASPEAEARFRELLDELRKQLLDAHVRGLGEAVGRLTPDDLRRTVDMLAELNDMLEARARGEPADFDGFISRHGHLFPERPRNLDELVDALTRRARAASRLAAALTPDQRGELERLTRALLHDVDLDWELSRLDRSLRALRPDGPWDDGAALEGEEALPLGRVLDAVERLTDLDELERQLSGGYPGASLDDVDEDRLRRSLGDDAVRDLRRLKAIERALEEGSVLARSRGRLRLTARGARLVGERSLARLHTATAREPSHRAAGGQGEPTGQTRPWAFGDPEPLSVQRTVFNAVARSAEAGRVRLRVEDFEVAESESRPRTATALLLDLSYSMPLGGHWLPAKRTALALAALIEGRYPQDELVLIGFSDYAREMSPVDLACAAWEHVHGTNMHHAFLLARRRLGAARAQIKQVVMVTDGEPTAHLDRDGRALFHWPPTRETVETTLREAVRLARSGISLNVHMLESTPGLVAFMERLARLTGGCLTAAQSQGWGGAIVGGYGGRPPARS